MQNKNNSGVTEDAQLRAQSADRSLGMPRIHRQAARRASIQRVRQPRASLGSSRPANLHIGWNDYIDASHLYKPVKNDQAELREFKDSDEESWGETLRSYMSVTTKIVDTIQRRRTANPEAS